MITHIALEIGCNNCDEPIQKLIAVVHDGDEIPAIHAMNFEQSSWECPECGHITLIGDIDMIDSEDL